MTPDLEDLLEIISQLEKRIMQLELQMSKNNVRDEDAWYWDH